MYPSLHAPERRTNMSTFCRNVTETTPFQFSRTSEQRRLVWLLHRATNLRVWLFAQHWPKPRFARFSSLSNHYKYDALALVNFAKFIKLHLLQSSYSYSSSSSSSSSFQAFVSYVFSYCNGKEGRFSLQCNFFFFCLFVLGLFFFFFFFFFFFLRNKLACV